MIGVIAQRLARRLCQNCKEEYVAEAATCEYFGLPDGTTLYRGTVPPCSLVHHARIARCAFLCCRSRRNADYDQLVIIRVMESVAIWQVVSGGGG
jgi:type II secretory ATPase GspE/PulE/Tfp pilus assembly ATPase PilB-like protein